MFVPWLFVVYASNIFEIVDKHNLEMHCYADYSQLYLSFCPNDTANQEAALARVETVSYTHLTLPTKLEV